MTPAAHLETNLSTGSAARQRGRALIVALLFAGLLATSVGMAVPALAVLRYQATSDGLALRSGPGTGHAVLQRVNRGTPLDASCGVIGQNIGGNSVWLRLTGGQYVSDYYTTSDGWGTRLPTGLPGCTAPAVPPRARGVTQPTNTAVQGQCTWAAKEQFRAATGMYPALTGDAWYWATSARSKGWTVVNNAETRSIVVFQPGVQGAGGSGHVAWVENVEARPDGRYIHIVEMNFPNAHQWSRRVVKHVAGMEYVLAP